MGVFMSKKLLTIIFLYLLVHPIFSMTNNGTENTAKNIIETACFCTAIYCVKEFLSGDFFIEFECKGQLKSFKKKDLESNKVKKIC